MIDVILAIKFVHVLTAAVLYGTWLGAACFMVMATRSANPSVAALVAQFAVRIQLFIVAPMLALQPIAGFPLAWAIGLAPLNEFWIVVSLGLYGAVVALWLGALRVEMRLRDVARAAALERKPLTDAYPRLVRAWLALDVVIFSGFTALILLMVWQPRLD